jgi:hypothetical protein
MGAMNRIASRVLLCLCAVLISMLRLSFSIGLDALRSFVGVMFLCIATDVCLGNVHQHQLDRLEQAGQD